jgi:hypothetical protein
MSTPGVEADFRRWLVSKLLLTRWPFRQGEKLEELAERLWVHPDALRRAQAQLDARQRKAGRPTKRLLHDPRPVRERLRVRIDCSVPPVAHRAIHGFCKLRAITPATLIRSLLHAMLLEARNPELTEFWWYEGQRLSMRRPERGRRSEALQTLKSEITAGAHRALTARALEAGVKPTTLLRGLLQEALHNQRLRFEILTRVSQMWDDETRYICQVGK